MKKIFLFITAICIICSALIACTKSKGNSETTVDPDDVIMTLTYNDNTLLAANKDGSDEFTFALEDVGVIAVLENPFSSSKTMYTDKEDIDDILNLIAGSGREFVEAEGRPDFIANKWRTFEISFTNSTDVFIYACEKNKQIYYYHGDGIYYVAYNANLDNLVKKYVA